MRLSPENSIEFAFGATTRSVKTTFPYSVGGLMLLLGSNVFIHTSMLGWHLRVPGDFGGSSRREQSADAPSQDTDDGNNHSLNSQCITVL